MEASAASDEPVAKEVYIEAPPDIVYAYFTDAAKMREWIGTELEIEPRPGGTFRIVPNRVDVIRGEFLETVPFSRVVFTWGFEGEGHEVAAGSTAVEITLEPEGDGTRLRLVHRNLRGDWRERHAAGWDHYIARIRLAAEGGTPAADPYADPAHRHG